MIAQPARRRLQLVLLSAGVVGPVQFTLVYLVEGATRPGYDAMRNAVSALSLTQSGVVDIVSLVLNGLLLIGFAVGVHKSSFGGRHGFLVPLLLGLVGVGFVVAGIFVTDPAQGYPPGTPAGPSVVNSVHGQVHFFVGATLAFGGLTVSALAFAKQAAGDADWKGAWPFYSVLSSVGVVGFFVAFAYEGLQGGPAGLFERLSFSCAFLWVVLFAVALVHRDEWARVDD